MARNYHIRVFRSTYPAADSLTTTDWIYRFSDPIVNNETFLECPKFFTTSVAYNTYIAIKPYGDTAAGEASVKPNEVQPELYKYLGCPSYPSVCESRSTRPPYRGVYSPINWATFWDTSTESNFITDIITWCGLNLVQFTANDDVNIYLWMNQYIEYIPDNYILFHIPIVFYGNDIYAQEVRVV